MTERYSYRGVTHFGPLLWQAEAGTEVRMSASPAAVVGQKASDLAKRRYSAVFYPLPCHLFAIRRTLNFYTQQFPLKADHYSNGNYYTKFM